MMEGASAQDWWWIKNYDLLEEKVAVYVPDACEVQPVALHGVPWPIVWILSRYNKSIFGLPERCHQSRPLRGRSKASVTE